MNMRFFKSLFVCAGLCHSLWALSQHPAATLLRKEPVMLRHAEGTFTVKTASLPPDDATAGTPISRFGLDKEFHGGLEAASKGEMLGAGDFAKGSAGYVAIEQIIGTLNGRSGSFALQHIGAMDSGKVQLSVTVVQGSGTGELVGITGSMTITDVAGRHSYTFEYAVPDAH
jgi:hypothetical protein